VFVHALGRTGVRTDRTGVSERSHERMLATPCHPDARTHERRTCVERGATEWRYLRCTERVITARTVCLLARRRLKRERERRAGQAVKLFENRLLLVSKAMAPFVMTGEFYALPQSEVNMLR
jgi:hypothetical protein